VTPRVPSAEEQIDFLANIQTLLDEGQFVASYKFALLIALADLAVELGDDSGRELELPLEKIAEKFVAYLLTPEAQAVLAKNGFKPAPTAAP